MSKVAELKMDSVYLKFKHELDEIEPMVIQQLSYIGERAVTFARTDHDNNWGDVTGNLRSSIGYVILKDGHPVINGETQQYSGPNGDGSEGLAAGKALLKKLQGEFPKGMTLIICAGMNYASYVEDIHGKDVLTGAKMLAETLVQKLLKGY